MLCIEASGPAHRVDEVVAPTHDTTKHAAKRTITRRTARPVAFLPNVCNGSKADASSKAVTTIDSAQEDRRAARHPIFFRIPTTDVGRPVNPCCGQERYRQHSQVEMPQFHEPCGAQHQRDRGLNDCTLMMLIHYSSLTLRIRANLANRLTSAMGR